MDKRTEISLVKQAIKSCHSCSLRLDGTTPVHFTGHISPSVAVVGIGPGEREVATGVPWTGKAGRYTKDILKQYTEMDISKFAWLNVVCCGDNPKQPHIDACRLHFNRQINALSPKFILVFGSPAANAMLRFNVTMATLHGKWWKSGSRNVWTMATYHPASTLHDRNPTQLNQLIGDLEKFSKSILLEDLAKPRLEDYCIKCSKIGIVYLKGLPFCRTHAPARLKVPRNYQDVSLFE